jgi:uncharacterized protein DUF1844
MPAEEEKPIRIVDRRMFTAEGELRPEFQAEEAAETPKPPSPAAPPPQDGMGAHPQASPGRGEMPEEPAEPAEPHSDFAALIRSLATSAYSSLGLLPDPSGARRRDVAVARQMIDWLAMLEQKTRGNVSFEESDFLSRILYELRLAYVEMTRPAK